MRVLLLLLLPAAVFARTVKLDASVNYILVGETECVNPPPPVRGSPRICMSQTSSLMLGPFRLFQGVDGTVVFKKDGSTVAAINIDGAMSVGPTISFGEPGSVTVSPQKITKYVDRIWDVKSKFSMVNSSLQTVSLIGTSARGFRIKYAGTNSSVVILNTGQVVVDNNINRNLVVGGIRSGAMVITSGSVFAPGRKNVPVVITVPVPVDGLSRITMTTYSSPSFCGNSIARQTAKQTISANSCLTLTNAMKSVLGPLLTEGDIDDYTSVKFPVCLPPNDEDQSYTTMDVLLYTDGDCENTASATIEVTLGACIDEKALFECVHAI